MRISIRDENGLPINLEIEKSRYTLLKFRSKQAGLSLDDYGSMNESITVSGTDTYGVTACVEAQKLDASNSVLSLQASNVVNQTALPYGTTKICLAYVII